MDYIKILKADLEKGYSMSDLEKLIGLPKNGLSGILKGGKKLSKKSKLKIAVWEKSAKPNPLELDWEELLDTKIDFKEPDENSYDVKKQTMVINDEYGQIGNSGEINRDIWKHTNIKISEKEVTRHKLWKEGDPREGSNGFFLKYGAFKYDEITKK